MVVLGLLVWRFRRKRLSLFILAFLILATVVMAPGHYWTRTKTIVDYGEERAAQSRLDLWKAGLQMFVDHPLTGVGQGNFLWISPRYTSNYYRVWTGEGYVAHNIFIQLLAEGGIQALLVFLAFVAVTFRGLSKARRYLFHSHRGRDLIELSQAVEIGLIGFLISGIFLSSAHLDVFYWFLAMGPVICTLAGQESGRLSGIRGSETLVGAAFAGSVKGT
jgi:O-antigen ligase